MTRRGWLALAGGGLIPSRRADGQPAGFAPLFDGRSLAGWTPVGGAAGTWRAGGGILSAPSPGKSWLSTDRAYADFELRLAYRLDRGGNSGILLRAPRRGDPSYEGVEVQLLDDAAPEHRDLRPAQYAGSAYGVVPARRGSARPAGAWNDLAVRFVGPALTVTLNGAVVLDDRLDRHAWALKRHPGLARTGGFVGLQAHETPVWFRDLAIRPL